MASRQSVLILDYGAQYTQLIARRIREHHVYCEIHPGTLSVAEVKKLDTGGPITVKALQDGDIDVALLFTGSSVIPKNAVLLEDDQGLQPADNPVFLITEDKATSAVMKTLNAVSRKMTTKAYNDMSLAISEDKEDPEDAAAAFLEAAGLD